VRTNKLTDKQTPLKTSVLLRYATPVGNQAVHLPQWLCQRLKMMLPGKRPLNRCVCVCVRVRVCSGGSRGFAEFRRTPTRAYDRCRKPPTIMLSWQIPFCFLPDYISAV